MRRTAAGLAALVPAAMALAVMALAGCSLLFPSPRPQQAAHVPPRPHPAATTAPSGSAAAAAALHPSPPASLAVQPAAPAPPVQPAAPAPAPAASPPINVVGLSQADVRRQLGPPSASTAQGSAQTWTYRAADCAVAIAFYYDVTRGGFFALSARHEGEGDTAGCLAQIHDALRS